MAAEYVMLGGNHQVILCERGIRTFENFTRNTQDLSAVAVAKHLSHLPVIVDPSHGTGKWWLVQPMAQAAIAVGADGLMVEVHPVPSEALSDGEQSLTFKNFQQLMGSVRDVARAVGRRLAGNEHGDAPGGHPARHPGEAADTAASGAQIGNEPGA